jgi:hypothetical protein
LNVAGQSASITLQPGEYHVYLNKDLSNTLVTSIFKPAYTEFTGEVKLNPNPVKNGSILSFETQKSGEVQIDILDQNGAKIAQVFKGIKAAGQHKIVFNEDILHKISSHSGILLISTKTNNQYKNLKFLR